ncbi:PD-(D/E)XK nuclease family protein [Patescibacteria group bacterium]|uniref:PD-(D/E)XK endonuclease-like domain-containing protein n=1 Tax=viral metagenome TaxID=1070528 RepID=A0A6M3LWC3_9ZZZZ|nr:PD-(D/E)XK nuclease family protein [Patescibacteria group bacterium]
MFNISYSKLSKLADSPRACYEYLTIDIKPTKEMLFGSLVDCILTTPEKISEVFHISDVPLPSKGIANIIDTLAQQNNDIASLDSIEDLDIFSIARMQDYYNNRGRDTIVAEVRAKGGDYFNDIINGLGKYIVSADDLLSANKVVEVLRTHPMSSVFLNSGVILYQHKLKFEDKIDDNTVTYNGIPDIIRITENQLQIIDLKTVNYNATDFARSLYKYKYYLQPPMYIDLVNKGFSFDKKLEVVFIFLVIGVQELLPIPYFVPEKSIEAGRSGWNQIKGSRQLSREFIWHSENNLWDYPYEIYRDRCATILIGNKDVE